MTDNSVVYYNYSVIGTFTVKLKVVAEWEETKPDGTSKGIVQRTGDFSASLKLQGEWVQAEYPGPQGAPGITHSRLEWLQPGARLAPFSGPVLLASPLSSLLQTGHWSLCTWSLGNLVAQSASDQAFLLPEPKYDQWSCHGLLVAAGPSSMGAFVSHTGWGGGCPSASLLGFGQAWNIS